MQMNLLSRYFAAAPFIALLALAGCASSPPVHFYTLVSGTSPASESAPRGDHVLIDVATVDVPAQADQAQLMVRRPSGEILALYSERWTSPLADEVRSAISGQLIHDLNAIDVQTVKPADGVPIWRIQVDIQRFDSSLGKEALMDATWRVRAINFNAPLLLCSVRVRVRPADASVQGIVNAHQEALAQLAATIASAVRTGGRSARASSDEISILGCSQGTDSPS
jgi:uncharacterized lipoprotein YmbA